MTLNSPINENADPFLEHDTNTACIADHEIKIGALEMRVKLLEELLLALLQKKRLQK